MIRERLEQYKVMIIERMLEILIDLHKKLEDEPINDWNVWLINTKTHLAVVAAKDEIGEAIPEDGSFINGMCIHSGLSEIHAREKVSEYSAKFGFEETIDEDLN